MNANRCWESESKNLKPNQHFVYSTVSAQQFRVYVVHNPTTVCAVDTVTFRMWSSLKEGNEAVTGGQTVITGKIKI